MLSKEKFDEMQSVIADCKTLNGMAFSGNHYKISQFQKAPALLGDALDEILSLREQLAELKALEPFCHVFLHPDGPLFNGIVSDSYAGHAGVIPLFTAAKPAGLDVEDITEFMRKAFWRGFESARGTGNSNIPEYWKDSKPNLLLALKAKISGA